MPNGNITQEESDRRTDELMVREHGYKPGQWLSELRAEEAAKASRRGVGGVEVRMSTTHRRPSVALSEAERRILTACGFTEADHAEAIALEESSGRDRFGLSLGDYDAAARLGHITAEDLASIRKVGGL